MNEQYEKQYIKMTQTPVPNLVLRLAVPTTISMLITSIYNTADTYFVSKISISASGATGVVFSIMSLLQAFGFMFGHGAGTNVSRLLGAKDTDNATLFTTASFFLALFTGIIICAVSLVFIEPLMQLLGSTDTILPEAVAYGKWIFIGAPGLLCSCMLNNVLRYEGRANFSMIGLTAGGILNIFLDPLLIFGLNMGTSGAGIATMISQYVSMIILLTPFIRKRTTSRIRPRFLLRSLKNSGNIMYSGLPNLMRQGLNSIANALLNSAAGVYGDAAVAAFSIVNRISGLIFSFSLGLAQGFQPVSAFNYGAQKYSRVRKAYYFTVSCSFLILAVLCSLCAIFAKPVICIFRSDTEVLQIGIPALRYLCAGMMFLPLSGTGSMQFQSIGYKKNAVIASVFQNGAVYIPLLIVLPKLFGICGLQFCRPVSYAASGIMVLFMTMKLMRELAEKEKNEESSEMPSEIITTEPAEDDRPG